MKFDVYGRFQIEVHREDGKWVAYRVGPGKRSRINDFVIPREILTSREIARYLDDPRAIHPLRPMYGGMM